MNTEDKIVRCELCGEPMPKGEVMFKYHGYSGSCPKPPLVPKKQEVDWRSELETVVEYLDIPDIRKAGTRALLISLIVDLMAREEVRWTAKNAQIAKATREAMLQEQAKETVALIRESVIGECIAAVKNIKLGELHDDTNPNYEKVYKIATDFARNKIIESLTALQKKEGEK